MPVASPKAKARRTPSRSLVVSSFTPDAIRRQIDRPEPLSGHAKDRLEQLVMAGVFFNSLQNLQANSSDLLLVALLPKMARIFVRDSSQDLGIARIREMAQDYIATTTEAGSEGRASDA